MRIDIKQLQTIVDEETHVDYLREEIKRVLGPSVILEGEVSKLAKNANERIEVLERTRRNNFDAFDVKVILPFTSHKHSEVRRLAAKVLPENYLTRMLADKSPSVRSVLASRLPMNEVKKLMRNFPNDENVENIFFSRKNQFLKEDGIPNAKPDFEEFDMYGSSRMGDSDLEEPELSDSWYDQQASKLIQDYGRTLEKGWERKAVRNLASATRASSGIVVDQEKLLSVILDKFEEDEQDILDRPLPAIGESKNRTFSADKIFDDVQQLFESKISNSDFISSVESLLRISHSTAPKNANRFSLNENKTSMTKVPNCGFLPHGKSIRSIDEKLLDKYCQMWNASQKVKGEQTRISWSPTSSRKISFSLELKLGVSQICLMQNWLLIFLAQAKTLHFRTCCRNGVISDIRN